MFDHIPMLKLQVLKGGKLISAGTLLVQSFHSFMRVLPKMH
jgi:hypothetical protein